MTGLTGKRRWGGATHDVAGRVLAMTGKMDAAQPVFAEPAQAVAGGGVLAGLPMLLQEGLLAAAGRLLRLPNGFYGVASVLLFVAFLTLGRVRNAESLRMQAPGEWGILLGLDRCPEVKTLRRKLRLLAGCAGRGPRPGRMLWRDNGWLRIRQPARPLPWTGM